MKIVIFGDAFSYPPKEGLSRHVMSLLEGLSKTARIRPVLFLCDRGLITHETIAGFPWKTVLIPPDTYYDYKEVRKLLDAEKPDVIQAYNVYHARLIASPYSLERKIPLVMEHHDLEVELARFIGLSDKITAQNIEHQKSVARVASLNRTLSGQDTAHLTEWLPQRKNTFITLPTGIPDDFRALSYDRRKKNEVVFIGNGGYPPNRRALKFITEELAPALPHVTFHLVGRHSELVTPRSNVVAHGLVDNLSDIMERVAFGIAPLEVGSGAKVKVIHYMSAGLPAVGTPVAFAGFGDNPAFISTSLPDFARTLADAIKRTDLPSSREIRQNFLDTYHTDAITPKLLAAYANLRFTPEIKSIGPIQRNDGNLAWTNSLQDEQVAEPVTQPVILGAAP